MLTPCVSLLLLAATLASAQSPRVGRPIYLELGAFFPNYRGADFGHDLGVAAGLGYSFAERGDFRLSGEIRGAYHLATLGSGGSSGTQDANLTIRSALLGLRHRHHGTPLFTGLAIGVGQAVLDGGDDRTEAVFGVEVGYDVVRNVYLGARYQLSRADALRGATLGLGVRF